MANFGIEEEEFLLPEGLNMERMPKHVAVIPDGNTRWCRKNGVSLYEGLTVSFHPLFPIVKMSLHFGIKVLTVFAFSTENWSRSYEEVRDVMIILEENLTSYLETPISKEKVRLRVIGDTSRVPESLRQAFEKGMEETKNNKDLTLIVAMSYGGRADIVSACKKVATMVENGEVKPCDISESMVGKCLMTSVDKDEDGNVDETFGYPDLLIRTGGEQRISNFLLWQCAYSELYFEKCLWPEFELSHYVEALKDFQSRERRFGKRHTNPW